MDHVHRVSFMTSPSLRNLRCSFLFEEDLARPHESETSVSAELGINPLQRSCPVGLGFFNTITMSLFDLIVIGMIF